REPPTDGQQNTSKPAIISIVPTIIMNVCGMIGSDEATVGARYWSQLAKMSKNLSSPATIGARMNAAYNRLYAWCAIRRSSAVSKLVRLGVLSSVVSVLISDPPLPG